MIKQLDYIIFYKLLCIAFILLIILLVLSFILIYREYDYEKVSIYECGFLAIGNSREQMSIRFYIIAVLFLIFDVELLFIYPYVFVWHILSNVGLYILFIFYFALILGLIYEYTEKALDWH